MNSTLIFYLFLFYFNLIHCKKYHVSTSKGLMRVLEKVITKNALITNPHNEALQLTGTSWWILDGNAIKPNALLIITK